MKLAKMVAIALIAGGVLGLVYGGFSFTRNTHRAKVGPFEFAVKEKERVNLPVWLSVGAIAAGTGLLLFGGKKR